jgi:DEAD/DEAH box helicase domain-containing protein
MLYETTTGIQTTPLPSPSLDALKKSNTVILDLEIVDPIRQQSDWDNTEKIRISCVVLYSYHADRFHIYGKNDIDRLRAELMTVDCIVGYNTNKFDLPVIYGLPKRQRPNGLKSFDILAEVWKTIGLDPNEFTSHHAGYSLNSAANATLNKSKNGTGAGAPELWQHGEYCKVIDYCINDVALTKELFEYIILTGSIKYKRRGVTETIIFNTERYSSYMREYLKATEDDMGYLKNANIKQPSKI